MFATQQNQETWSASCTSPLIFHMRNQSSEGTRATTAGERPLREVEGALASEAEMLWTQASPLTSLSVRTEQGCTNSRGASTDTASGRKLRKRKSRNQTPGVSGRSGTGAQTPTAPARPEPSPLGGRACSSAARPPMARSRSHAAERSLLPHPPSLACGSPCLLRGSAQHRPLGPLKDSDR